MAQTNNQQQRTPALSASSQMNILHSSEALGWKEIVIEQRSYPAGEHIFPCSSFHMIGLHLGPPLRLEIVCNGQSQTCMISRGSIQIIPAGTVNIWRHQADAEHVHVFLTPALVQQVAAEYGRDHTEVLNHWTAQDLRIEHISSALLIEVLEGGATGRLYVESLTRALVTHLLQAYTATPSPLPQVTQGGPASLVRSMTELIEDHLTEDLSLTSLAAEAGLSPSYFSSLFRQTAGLSLHQYIIRRRLEQAQHLLRSTELPIKEIAIAVGFYDQSHLVRQMRRILGVTPTSLRKQLSSDSGSAKRS